MYGDKPMPWREKVRLFGRNVIIPLPWECRFWRVVHVIQEPKGNLADWRKYRDRPKPGEMIYDCTGKQKEVERIDLDKDTLFFTDGTSASWMNCCDREP